MTPYLDSVRELVAQWAPTISPLQVEIERVALPRRPDPVAHEPQPTVTIGCDRDDGGAVSLRCGIDTDAETEVTRLLRPRTLNMSGYWPAAPTFKPTFLADVKSALSFHCAPPRFHRAYSE